MTKKIITPAVAIAGAALIGGLTAANIANAAENPFAAEGLTSGYMQLASSHDGEGKCGGEKAEGEGKCGGEKAEGEGKCGGEKAEGEGKCGEGKCGGAK
jgi:uncharacterized low-complexity protein